jgi:hypothetical protein
VHHPQLLQAPPAYAQDVMSCTAQIAPVSKHAASHSCKPMQDVLQPSFTASEGCPSPGRLEVGNCKL